MNEGFSGWIESIETVFAAHPERSRSVLEKRQHEHAAQTVRLTRIILEHPELVSVVAVDALLSGEPHESLIILNNLCYAVLGQTFDSREPQESNVIAFDEVHSYRIGTKSCLGHAAGIRTRADLGGAGQPEEKQYGEEKLAKSRSHARQVCPNRARPAKEQRRARRIYQALINANRSALIVVLASVIRLFFAGSPLFGGE